MWVADRTDSGVTGAERKSKPVVATESLAATQLAAFPGSQKQHRLILTGRSTFLKWGPQPHSKGARKATRKAKTLLVEALFLSELTAAYVGAGPAMKLC